MLVDDHQTMLWGLSRLVDGERPRMQVVGTARTCEEALEKVARLVPDVVVLDLDLEGRSALDILPSLVSNSVSRALILTAEREQKTLDSAVVRGARGVLRKDAAAEDVLRAIEKMHLGEVWLDGATVARVFVNPADSRKVPCIDAESQKQQALTTKERRIIDEVVDGNGAPNKVLAKRLFVTEHTLRNQLSSIYQKLGVTNRLELYVYAVKHHLTSEA
jgi:DNA-binding NarL/FixJ family response regulator